MYNDQSGYLERAADALKRGSYLIICCNNKFVLGHLNDRTDFAHKEKGHMENWLVRKSLWNLLQKRFRVLSGESHYPAGQPRDPESCQIREAGSHIFRHVHCGRGERVQGKAGIGLHLHAGTENLSIKRVQY